MENLLYSRAIGIEMFHKQGLTINRPNGSGDFVFIHFLTPVELIIDKEILRVDPDACILYAPPKAQFYRSLPTTALGNNWMHFTGRSCLAFLKSLDLPLNRPIRPVSTAWVSSELRAINDEKVRKEPHWELGLDNAIRRFLIHLARNLRPDAVSAGRARNDDVRELLLNLRDHMQETCYEPWTVERMAAAVHLSKSRFSVLYRRLFRTSPMADILHMRIELAKYYLGMMQMPIEDVAESCGFSSVYYFHRQFKKMNGITPGRFQRTYQGEDVRPATFKTDW